MTELNQTGEEQRLQLLADAIPQIVWLLDAQGRTEFLNRQWTAYTGATDLPSTAPETAERFVHPDDVAATLAAWQTAQRTGRIFQVEHRIRSASGEYRWFLARAEPHRDPRTGKVVRWFGTSTDVHLQKEAEQALQRSEARYRTLLDSIDEGFCVIQMILDAQQRAVDYRFLEANLAFAKHTGLENALGKTARELLPELEEHWIRTYGEVARTGDPVRFQSGSDVMGRWFDVFAFRIEDPESRKVALLFTDVTLRKRAEQERERLLEELRVERARLEFVFRHTPAFLAVLRGPEHVYGLVNDAFQQLVGHRAVMGRPVAESLPELVDQGFVELLDRVLETGEPFIGREIVVHLDGGPDAPPKEKFLDLSCLPILEADGTRSGVIAHGSDVTESVLARREIERLLRESEHARSDAEAARTEAEAANQVKADFLASMSHELRTPLNAIGGYVDLLDLGIHGPLNDAQREALFRVTANQRHLLTLINDVLAFAKLEAGHIDLDVRPLEACELLSGVEALVAPMARSKGIALSVQEGDPELRLLGDTERVRQILLNLITNAIKYTQEGGWVVRSCEADDEWVYMRVRDNGSGIPPEEQGRIFDPFQQVGRRLNQPQEGVGLGLAISRDLARAMGGELSVESVPDGGSTFTLRLPKHHPDPG